MAETTEWMPRIERVEAIVKKALASSRSALAFIGFLQNRVQQQTASGTVIAAAGAITLDAALTTKGPSGKIKISANYSGVGGGGAGGIHGLLQVKIGAGAFVTVYTWAPVATGGVIDSSVVFEFDSASPAGTVLTVHWRTTAGDDAVTIGGAVGAGQNGATLLVEELP
jgi:hypothetical protein